MSRSIPPADPGDEREAVIQDYERYRAEYERLRDDLLQRDRRAKQDPFTLQRWPRERKAYADKVDQALLNWETYGHRAQVEAASGAHGRPGDGEHDEIDDEPRLRDRRPLHHSTTTRRCLATPQKGENDMPDVFKILKDLEAKAVGVDPNGDKMQEGFFVAFRSVGLPIHKDDYDNPWDPFGGNLSKALEKAAAQTPPADPATAPKTASGGLGPNQIAVAAVGRSMKTYLNTFILLDNKLQMRNDYAVMPGSSKVSDSWWAIITGANGVPTKSELSPELQAAYDAAKAVLTDKDDNPTPRYQAYMDREDEYKGKVKAYNRAYAAAMTDPIRLDNWPRDGVLYQQDVDEAMDRWNGLGHKPEIDKAIATLAAQGTDPAIALISRAKQRFQNSLINFPNIGDLPYTLLSPETWYDADNDDGWTVYTNAEAHSESHFHSSSTSFGGSVGINVGLWSVGGGFDSSEQKQNLNIKADDLEISFSYCAADIYHAGIDSSLLNLGNWFLMGDYAKECISDGSMKQELPADRGKEPVFLPSIVTSLVLIKDLSIRWSNWQADWASQESHVSAGGSVGYGPFAVSGHYSHGDQSRDFTADSSGESLTVHGVQLLGYVSMINPASPGLNSSDFLKKPDH